MRQPPGSGKDIVAQVITYLRQNKGVAILSSPILAKEWGCNQSNVSWDIRRLIGCRIITPIDKWGSGHRNTRFQLSNEFKEGDGWRDVLLNYAPLIVHKKSVPGEKENNAASVIIDRLRANGCRAVINGTALAKELGFSRTAISYALRTLIKKGLLATTGPIGQGIRSPEFVLTEKGKSCVVPELSQEARTTKGVRKTTSRVGSHDDTTFKLSISRELVQVYEKLNEAQQLALKLQSDKDQLEVKVKELEDELQLERGSRNRDANDIAKLELQLRELRQLTGKNARQAIFNHRGIQS